MEKGNQFTKVKNPVKHHPETHFVSQGFFKNVKIWVGSDTLKTMCAKPLAESQYLLIHANIYRHTHKDY